MSINFSLCHTNLDKIGKITLENVSKANEATRQILRNNTPTRLKELAQLNCYAADKIKTELDKTYGTNNYVVVAIGRSISSIAELAGHLGVDTKIIPLSGLRRNSVDNIRKDALHMYKSFLVQKNLSKKDLKKNKNKTYVFMDYACYGTSLKRAEELIKKEELLGKAKNIRFMSINEILGFDYEKRGFNKLFEYSRFKDYSYVGKLHISKLEEVFSRCSPDRVKEFQGNITQILRKLFWFNVFDSIKNKSYGNIVPSKELNALYKHCYSQLSLKFPIRREKQNIKAVIDFISSVR